MARSVTDGVIETLALSEAELLERVVSLEVDVDSYRALAQAGVTALRDKTLECDRYHSRVQALVAEVRGLRGDLQTLGAQLRALQHQGTVAA